MNTADSPQSLFNFENRRSNASFLARCTNWQGNPDSRAARDDFDSHRLTKSDGTELLTTND